MLGTEDIEMDLIVLTLKKFTVKWKRKLYKLNCKAALTLSCDIEVHKKHYGRVR